MNDLDLFSALDATAAPLSLGIEELESMEAPGFWEGFGAGLAIAGLYAAGVAVT